MSGDARIAKPASRREAGWSAPSYHLAYFGHDAGDAAVRRRVQALGDDGIQVTGFMMRRGEATATPWKNVDLGQTHDGAFLQRARQIFAGAGIAAKHRDELAQADVICARNLDMLACAFLAKHKTKLETPVIYEALDVHRLLTRSDLVGRAMRWLEGWLLSRTCGLVVSSPAFLRNHFERYYSGRFTAAIVENRMAAGSDYGPRPEPSDLKSRGKLRIGWVGVLRCQRSFDLLCELADKFQESIEIHLHGVPARVEIPVFEPLIEKRANMTYHGRYTSPEDLGSIYNGLDVVWAGDFMEAGYNSVWLLPNRIYEGGYYATPAIAPAGTETASWIEVRGCGFIVGEPLQHTLADLVTTLLAEPNQIDMRARRLAALPESDFVQPHGFFRQVLSDLLEAGRNA